MSKKTVATVVLTTVALTAGGFGAANAATKSTRTVVTKSVTKVSKFGTHAPGISGPVAALDGILNGLVSKGTITAEQAKAIKDAFVLATQTAKANGLDKGFGIDRAEMNGLIASILGLDASTIKSRLKAGETLASIAGSKKEVLVTALVAKFTKRIDAAFNAGKITAEQAATLKANLAERVTQELNKVQKMGKHRHVGPLGAPAPLGTPTN